MRGVSVSTPSVPSPTALKSNRCGRLGLLSPSQSLQYPWRLRGSGGVKVHCSNSRPGSGPGGDNESKAVLDAFFLGKAFAEALNERIGSSIGEVLSVIGQWQAEQQKQVQDFQDEVLERATKAKEKAALEVIEEQGVILRKSSMTSSAPVTPSASSSSPPPNPSNENPFVETDD
ncbi:Uncharacterized protein QJS10_CPB18g01988 [Acorus calamus]|uniref:Uncharacterized protein n=1 Tax=Acorus calamus TaxID=4465 RepID=A0AAV9CMJ0_ACOCL|nr:Uncharacterized protein QJS10_CPB18g01988 [Acorus calamus]